MKFQVRLGQISTLMMVAGIGCPAFVAAQASAPDSGKGEVVCAYLRVPPILDAPTPVVIAFLAFVAFLAFCIVGVLIQSSRRNRVLEEQVANLMKANARDLPGISNRS